MNITQQQVDDVNLEVTLEIEKADYAAAVSKKIKETAKKVSMPGFRPGKVPVALVTRMYGTQVTIDEVNNLINRSLYNYISENKISVLGEPMISSKQEQVDFATVDKFTAVFDLAIAPQFDLTLSQDIHIPYYNITVSDTMIDGRVSGYQRQYGNDESAEEATEDDVIKGNIAQLDGEGNLMEGGISLEGATVYPRFMKNADEKAKFAGAKKYASVDFNPAAAYDNNYNEVASLLGKKADEVEGLTDNFRFSITEIHHHAMAAVDSELFKQVFGDECENEEQFRAKIAENIAAGLKDSSDYKFSLDARDVLINRVGELKFPEETLKRWLLLKNDKLTAEKVDADFPQMMRDLTWQLIEEKVAAANQLEVSEEEAKKEAELHVRAQMIQYGMNNIPDEYIKQYAENLYNDEKQRPQFRESALTRKVFATVRSQVSLDEQTVSIEDFQKMLNPAPEAAAAE